MSDWNKRIESKLDTIVDDIGAMKVTSAEQHIVLKEHVRRTELLEEAVKPLEKHVYMVNGVLKFLGVLGLLASIVEALMWVFKR